MQRFIIPIASQENHMPISQHRWKRSSLELDGKISFRYRRESFQLLLDLYAEVRSFGHNHCPRLDCPTHAARVSNQNKPNPFLREGITGLEFDSKGIYLASVTKSGCLTVLDFETLYCSVYGPYSDLCEDETKCLLHICTSKPFDVVRWNPANQDEVCSVSRNHNTVFIYDIGYVSSEPIEVLEKRLPKYSQPESWNGLSEIAFASTDKSRLLASGLDGSIYIWDRRLSNLPCVRLSSSSQSPLNSIEVDVEDRIVFGANQQGIIDTWDLRGGRSSFAFQSHTEVYAVGSSAGNGVYLLDFFPAINSTCHVKYSNEPHTVSGESKGAGKNRFIPVSEGVLACAVHPQNGIIVAGSKKSSLLMVSQKHQTDGDPLHEI